MSARPLVEPGFRCERFPVTESTKGATDGDAKWAELISWLEEIQRLLPLYGKGEDRETCQRVIDEISRCRREEAALAELTSLKPAVRQCLGGTRSFLRVVSAGHVDLTPELRAELVEMVREISEIVMAHDLVDC